MEFTHGQEEVELVHSELLICGQTDETLSRFEGAGDEANEMARVLEHDLRDLHIATVEMLNVWLLGGEDKPKGLVGRRMMMGSTSCDQSIAHVQRLEAGIAGFSKG